LVAIGNGRTINQTSRRGFRIDNFAIKDAIVVAHMHGKATVDPKTTSVINTDELDRLSQEENNLTPHHPMELLCVENGSAIGMPAVRIKPLANKHPLQRSAPNWYRPQ